MNIFIFDLDFETNARMHCDRHVVKMITEYNQLLSSAHHMLPGPLPKGRIYKLTHKNHPCAVWTRKSLGNYCWLHSLNVALCAEYTHRYGKVHAGEAILRNLQWVPDFDQGDMTPFAMAMPDECKRGDVVESYRTYFNTKKQHIASWKYRDVPQWFRKEDPEMNGGTRV